ncbi:MAG: hypothetical protein OXH99_10205 [Bryobacterales bacterium]|nr:hypothetical protein [Bryobacterales bacterium]
MSSGRSGSPDGARVAGLMFGAFATLRLPGPNPHTWMPDCLGACADSRGRPTGRLDAWPPWLTDEDRKRELRGPVRKRGADRPAC